MYNVKMNIMMWISDTGFLFLYHNMVAETLDSALEFVFRTPTNVEFDQKTHSIGILNITDDAHNISAHLPSSTVTLTGVTSQNNFDISLMIDKISHTPSFSINTQGTKYTNYSTGVYTGQYVITLTYI